MEVRELRRVSDSGNLFGRCLVEVVVEDAKCFLHHLCLSLHEDQLHRSVNRVFVCSFDGALFDRGVCGNWLCSVCGEAIGAFCCENRFFGEVEDAYPAYDGASIGRRDRDAAVWRDVYGAARDRDGLLVGVEDGFALGRLEDSGGGAGEGAIARVSDAVCGLDGEEALTLQGEVEGLPVDLSSP